jgi:hypothetical protein
LPSRWQKRSQEDKERIAQEQSPEGQQKRGGSQRITNIRNACFRAKAAAGHVKDQCHACDLRCPGCPFEKVWDKQIVDKPTVKDYTMSPAMTNTSSDLH